MKPANQLLLLECVLAIVISGCTGSSFSGDPDDKKNTNTGPSAPATGTVALSSTCDLAATGDDIKVRSSMANSPIVFKGTLCPSNGAVSSVKQAIFVIDVSGSTGTTDPSSGTSCGRLLAAQQLAAALQQPGRTFALIVFDGKARLISKSVDISQANSILTFQNVCSNSTGLGGTNYDAAFTAVQPLLSPGDTGNLLFFMSDGFPNISNSSLFSSISPKQAGLNAINQCRAMDPALLTFGVFLNAEGGSSINASSYFTSLMGAPERVAVVSNAQDLAAAAVKLLPPVTTKITAVKAEGLLDAPGLSSIPVAADVDGTVVTDGVKPAIGFITKPFKLLGDPKAPIRQTLHVTMTDAAGQMYKQDYHLIYDPLQ